MIEFNQAWITILFTLVMITLNSSFIAASAVIYPLIFPKAIRYSATSLSYNLGNGIFGGSAPLLATWLVYQFGPSGLTALLMITSAVTITVLITLRYTTYASDTRLYKDNTEKEYLPSGISE